MDKIRVVDNVPDGQPSLNVVATRLLLIAGAHWSTRIQVDVATLPADQIEANVAAVHG